MDKLFDKYKSDKLSGEELQELRKVVNALSDDELAGRLETDWNQGEVGVDEVDEKCMERLKERIDRQAGIQKPWRVYVLRVAKMAAAILLPVLLVTTLYLYTDSRQSFPSDMIVSTGKGERASMTLPDGTKIALNYDSQVTYDPEAFAKGERRIDFDGEGYFQAKKDSRHPFVIHAQGLQVEVLGTVFNLLARNGDTHSELFLEEGSVRLMSVLTGEKVLLSPNQKAVLSVETGHIVVQTMENIAEASAWRKGDLIFRNEPLGNVLRTLEGCYGYKITTDCEDCLTDEFTGTLPTWDINEVLEVLEKLYPLEIEIKGKEIFLREQHKH